MARNTDHIIQSVDRAVSILECFSLREKELGVTEIGQRLGLHKSTVYGLLNTLLQRGYIFQNPETGRYRLGLKLMELGCQVEQSMEMREIARSHLHRLVDAYEETVHLVALDGFECIYIDKVEGFRAIRMYSQVGKRAPLYCTGVGKSLLAFQSRKWRDKYLNEVERHPFTNNTITDREILSQVLDEICKNGYSFDNEEIEPGLRCVAAPIFNFHGEVKHAISIAGPTTRMTKDHLIKLSVPVRDTAAAISRNLGYTGIFPWNIQAQSVSQIKMVE